MGQVVDKGPDGALVGAVGGDVDVVDGAVLDEVPLDLRLLCQRQGRVEPLHDVYF